MEDVKPRKTIYSFYITDEMRSQLKQQAKKRMSSQSDIVRSAIAKELNGNASTMKIIKKR